MLFRSQLTPLAEATPGMVLGEVLRDGKGNMLLAQGAVLTEGMLASLARHGIELLPILGAAHAKAPVDPALVQERLDRVFRKHERGNQRERGEPRLPAGRRQPGFMCLTHGSCSVSGEASLGIFPRADKTTSSVRPLKCPNCPK